MIRETLAAMAVATALCLVGCAGAPDPRVAPYLIEARICALAAQRLDAGAVERYAAYDACETKAFEAWSADAGGDR